MTVPTGFSAACLAPPFRQTPKASQRGEKLGLAPNNRSGGQGLKARPSVDLAGWPVTRGTHSTARWYLQFSFGQWRTVSPVLRLFFSSRIGEPHVGHASATGLSQAVNLQSG